MSEYHRLTDQKYSEAEYLFQTIEMAKSDEEFNVELCPTPPTHTELELALMDNNDLESIYSWKLVKRRRPRRRYTVSHGGGGGGSSGVVALNGHNANVCPLGGGGGGLSSGLPPAPPSTPTSLTPTNTSLLSSSLPNSGIEGLVTEEEQQRLDSLLYILDYAPKYKKKLKEQQRTDAELAELFNVVSITASNGTSSSSSSSKTKFQPERGVSSTSRSIRKHDVKLMKIVKVHRNLNKTFREHDEEDSVSAPEYDTEEEDTRFHRLGRIKPSQRLSLTKRERRFARFEHAERMEAMVDIFDEAMNFNET
ncbi:uncharacterized protein LOC111681959 [Lucilia cuprina]|uniref:uncharacterized protein LOC111681959 n=1 Tax=Lucilia cuprina TaxID=7375 RepID=UPI001F05DB4A|nr:uncharacterized protein LOC111681959 [Lucilia cuprina]XP_046811098.1 uncharacterized protein LOC111681959 [Lucilia cuprina]